MGITTTSSCAPAAAKDVAPPMRSLQPWDARSHRWAGRRRVQRKRIGRDMGCELLWNPAFSRFEIRGGNPTARQSSKAALLCLEAKFHHDQALWTAKKAQRRADRLAAWMPTECYETHSSSLWHRHRRSRRKASDQRRQQHKVDSTRRSTAPGGRRSKPLEFGTGRSTRRSSSKVKRPARGANSVSCVYEQLLADRRALPFAVCADQQYQEWQQQYQEWQEWQEWWQLREQRKQAKERARAQLREQHKQAKEQAKARAKQKDPVRAAFLEEQSVAIKLDSAAQQQWDLLVKSRRWGGLLQGLINLLRPRFAGATMCALKRAFTLCDSSDITTLCDSSDITTLCDSSDITTSAGTVMPAGCGGNLKISAVLVQLLAPAKPKRRSPTAVGLVAREADLRREQAARLRLGRAVGLLCGDLSALTQAQTAYAHNQPTRPEPGPEPGPEEPGPEPGPEEPVKAEPEPLQKMCREAEWPELVVPGAAAA
jgi:hypothetical protein